MDLPAQDLQSLTLKGILKESYIIFKSSPKTFNLITLTLIFPLSLAILAHSFISQPLINLISITDTQSYAHHQFIKHFLLQFLYLIFLFIFSLLSTAAIVFTVASLYTNKPVSFTSSVAAIPSVFKRLFVTFVFFSVLIVLYNFAFVFCWSGFVLGVEINDPILFVLAFIDVFILFFLVHVKITALWHLASVISVLEPIYGVEAMKKSKALLKGKTMLAMGFVFGYLMICSQIGVVFRLVVVDQWRMGRILISLVVGVLLVGALVIGNLIGLLVQSVFYYVCKSHHQEAINKKALSEQLGGYLGDYVPLESSIEMEKLEV
ncbi:hypothetical protein ACHQM5_001940 [Ranunculus cassubicifolius]